MPNNTRTGTNMYVPFSDNSECQLSQLSCEKTQTSRLDEKQDPSICCLQDIHLTGKDKFSLWMTGWKRYPSYKRRVRKQTGATILIADNGDFKHNQKIFLKVTY